MPQSIDPARIFANYQELENTLEELRKVGKKIVLTSGTFDLFHPGHARYVRMAKNQIPDCILVVGVDSDEKVRRRKGPHRPIVPQEERLEIVSHARYVDFVVLKDPNDGKWALIKLIRPDVLVMSETTKDHPEKELKELQKFCGKVVVLEPQATTSTSAKIRLLHVNFGIQVEKLIDDTKETVLDYLEELKKKVNELAEGKK